MYYKCNEILLIYYWSMYFKSFLIDLNVKNYHLPKNKKHLIQDCCIIDNSISKNIRL